MLNIISQIRKEATLKVPKGGKGLRRISFWIPIFVSLDQKCCARPQLVEMP
jgi:hypothetical protein